ncbi:Hit family protein 1 [Rhizoctonia solani]|uniref:Hit family protein 1 n=1 Tax=Rhizoctonia solani TaxID=456999 RepID=A0A0K6G9F4_9AGAM|nr:Hit family protein 1 [Rhizoctonia solani]
MALDDDCLFCKIIKGEVPSYNLLETDHSYAFLDIFPVSKGHSLIIPKYHGEKLHDIPDEYLADLMPVAKKIAIATGATDYNILQNNGKIAHQHVFHVHFHVIPKPSASDDAGLVIGWPAKDADKADLQKILDEIKSRL